MKCTWCQQLQIRNLTIAEILLPWSIQETRCAQCQEKLSLTATPCCTLCMKQGQLSPCDECQLWQQKYPAYSFTHHAFFQYNDAFHDWIYRYKFLGDYRLRKTFSKEISHFFKQHPKSIVCAIPLSSERQIERGFNQSEALLSAANIPTFDLLKKSQHTPAQAQKNRQERLAMIQPFEATTLATTIQGKEVVIFDDVYTTGRTLFYAAETLMVFKPLKIRTLSLAR